MMSTRAESATMKAADNVASSRYRLHGMEPDNVLAFLALLGTLRALEAVDEAERNDARLHPRAGWDVYKLPVRPILRLQHVISREELLARIASGVDRLSAGYDFGERSNIDYGATEARELLRTVVEHASMRERGKADLMAALMCDAALKSDKAAVVAATPLCLQFGQGHQHFLRRLAQVTREPAPPARKRGAKPISATACLHEALFEPWHRSDPMGSSFRWDPEEDVRYALMAGNPTDPAYKQGTQHGANRLAALGVGALTGAPVTRGRTVRLGVLGGEHDRGFSLAWPVWRDATSLASIRALLSHPELRVPGALAHLGVEWVVEARRISVGKFMNFGRAQPIRPRS
jgi:hypothetical protein